MKIRQGLFGLFVLTGLLSSCKSEKKEQQTIQQFNDEHGHLAAEGQFIRDTIRHGWFRSFYPNGKTKDSAHYSYGQMNGWGYEFSEDGKLTGKFHWKKGVQDGRFFGYHSNGSLWQKGTFKNGKPFGAALIYHHNGKPKQFNIYDFSGEPQYVIEWDKQGWKDKEEGVVIGNRPVLTYLSDSNTFIADTAVKAGKDFLFVITVSEPPGYKAYAWYADFNEKGAMESLHPLPVSESTASIRRNYKIPGLYHWLVIGEIRDASGATYKRDTIHAKVNIIR